MGIVSDKPGVGVRLRDGSTFKLEITQIAQPRESKEKITNKINRTSCFVSKLT